MLRFVLLPVDDDEGICRAVLLNLLVVEEVLTGVGALIFAIL